ncbi:hypothetical protein [Chitinimonas sp. BJYL2]|uniref:hypothetical protein n=1 Tax=Chitinimonas sp. BJYL2 TaxID=2976696 RepID=UPI0022B54A5A|nr:hypothetical protein [Chitinimonas sp. BJYL2]
MNPEQRHALATRLATLPASWVAGFPLGLDATGVHGRYFKCELRSRYERHGVGSASLPLARLHARRGDGIEVPPEQLFRLASGADGLLKLDRLCRLIHTLNHCVVAAQTEPLLLPVHSRLFDYVQAAHGRTFARMLAHFDIAPDRVVLLVPEGLPQGVLDSYLGEGFGVRGETLAPAPMDG